MVKQKFMQFFDVNTNPDTFSVFTVKAGGDIVHKRLAPFFQAYKYYKLGRVNVKCVPASTLPVDPTGLSYEAGENTVDPRDQFNPGLIRITNGEETWKGGDIDMNRYYATMLDPRWYKFRLQSGFQRSAVPLVWNVADNSQNMYPSAQFFLGNDGKVYTHDLFDAPVPPNDDVSSVKLVKVAGSGSGVNTSLHTSNSATASTKIHYGNTENFVSVVNGTVPEGVAGGAFYVESGNTDLSDLDGADVPIQLGNKYPLQSGRVRLGWMPTDCMEPTYHYADIDGSKVLVLGSQKGYSGIPEVDLMTFVFPKAFKTKYYYRIFVETTVYFKDAVVIDPFIEEDNPVLPIDRFGEPTRLDGVVPYPTNLG